MDKNQIWAIQVLNDIIQQASEGIKGVIENGITDTGIILLEDVKKEINNINHIWES